MAQRLQVALSGLIDGTDDDVETVAVGWDGAEYSLGLCGEHCDEVGTFLGVRQRRPGLRSTRLGG